MRLPILKHLTSFIDENESDYVIETIETLEAIIKIPSLKDEELDVIGELITNMYGVLDVAKNIQDGVPIKEVMNQFMKRVMGSIDN